MKDLIKPAKESKEQVYNKFHPIRAKNFGLGLNMGIKLSNLTEISRLTKPAGISASAMRLALSSGQMKPSEVLEEYIANIDLY